jgi:hypothetical protein
MHAGELSGIPRYVWNAEVECISHRYCAGDFFSWQKERNLTRQLWKPWCMQTNVFSWTHYVLCEPFLCGHRSVRPLQSDSFTIHMIQNMNDRRGGLGCMMIILFLAASSTTVLCKLHLTIHVLIIFFLKCPSLCVYTLRMCWWINLSDTAGRPNLLKVKTARIRSNATTLDESKVNLIFCKRKYCDIKPIIVAWRRRHRRSGVLLNGEKVQGEMPSLQSHVPGISLPLPSLESTIACSRLSVLWSKYEWLQ